MLSLATAPTEEPVTLDEAKTFLRVDQAEEDPLITALIVSARVSAETITRRVLVTQTWDYALDSFPLWVLDVPLPPLQSVTSITYLDSNGVSQVLAASKYKVDIISSPGRITPAWGEVWPPTRGELNDITVRFVAGYGNAAAVPASIKQWMFMRIATLYEQREQHSTENLLALPHAFMEGLLDPYRVLTV